MIGNHGTFDFLGPTDSSIPGEAKQEDFFKNCFIRKVTAL